MELREAETLALAEMREHVQVPGWTFGWDNAVRRLGAADFVKKKITLSHRITAASTRAQVLDTIRHEIAHVNAGAAALHGRAWKLEALRLGANPAAATEEGPNLRQEAAPWRGTCPNGHEATPFWRRPKHSRSCAKCSPVFDRRYIITYRHVDTGAVKV